MTTHPLQWHAPEPLWARFGPAQTAVMAPDQFRPAILRFVTDEFMEQMLGTLARDPARVGDLLARPETWREQQPASADLVERVPVPRVAQTAVRACVRGQAKTSVPIIPAASGLKLFQPAHQRHYLVAASLVCGVSGMPDRALAPGGPESVGFVIRRMLPAAAGDENRREFAFVKKGEGASWRRVTAADDARALAPGEEILPLFPLSFRDEAGHGRTLWAGVIPVGRREEYIGATIDRTAVAFTDGQRQSLQPPMAPAPKNSKMARLVHFRHQVAEPWKNLVRAAYIAQVGLAENDGGSLANKRANARARNTAWQMQSWLILLDFSDYLAKYLPDLSVVIDRNGVGREALPEPQRNVYDWLAEPSNTAALTAALPAAPDGYLSSLLAALTAIRASGVRDWLESTDKLYDGSRPAGTNWPAFHFLLAGLDENLLAAGAFTAISELAAPLPEPAGPDEPAPAAIEDNPRPDMAVSSPPAEDLDKLTALIARAFNAGPELDAPAPPFALQLRNALVAANGDTGMFVIRCVHLNRDCGPLHPPMLSAPTQQFQLANFFDPDAPARPVRITLPLDTTPAGLRKHNKNTAFVISDVLCGQIQRAKGLGLGDLVRSVLPWPLHKDLSVGDGGACTNTGGINIGMICSLSIPIITICALILLIIIVSLLDFVFRWLPYFIMCFPVPGLGGKK